MCEQKRITLYPSNWLYNAGVIGFLRILEFGGKINDNIFNESNIVVNRELIKESYDLIFNYHKEKLGEEFSIWGKNERYPNYIQSTQKDFFKEHFVPALKNVENDHSDKTCNWCDGYFLPQNSL
ncbi:MAG: hypothetical protein ACK4GJ_07000, partial [bacterium]